MTRPVHDGAFASPVPPALARYLAARGFDPRLLVDRFRLPADLADRDHLEITLRRLDELLTATCDLSGDLSLGLRLPAELPFRSYRVHELAAHASADVRAALLRTARYASTIHPSLAFSLEEEAEEARWRQRILGHPRGIGRASHEYAIGSAVMHLRRSLGEAARLRRVWFVHPRPRDLGALHRFFATRAIDFGCEDNGLAFDRALLDRPLPTSDPRLLATLEPLAEAALVAQPPATRFDALVAARIRSGLPGATSVEAIADAMHMSPRTLQRRLEDHGAQFSEILDGVRADEARTALLRGTQPLAEIAWRLGYADLAGFSRAFKRWTGKAPGQFRRGG